MHLETDAVASFILKNLGDRCFVGGRPGLTLNAWKSWKESEKGWFLSHHASYPPKGENLQRFSKWKRDLLAFCRTKLSSFDTTPSPWKVLAYTGRCDTLPYRVAFTFEDHSGKSSSREGEFGDCSLVYWFGERVGFKGIGCGPAPKPPREGVADMFHLWENRMVRGWKITDVDMLIFSDAAWKQAKAVVEIKRTVENNWSPRRNDPHDILAELANALGVPYVLIRHKLDPRRTNKPAERDTLVDVMYWKEEKFDFERFLKTRKTTKLGHVVDWLAR